MMFAYFLGILVLIGWAVGDIFGGLNARKIGAVKTSFLVSLCGLILFLPGFISEFDRLKELSLPLLLLTVLLSLFWMLGNVVLNHGIATGYPSIVVSVGMSFAALVVILNSIFFDNEVLMLQWICIAIITLGVIIVGLDLKRGAETKKIVRSVGLGLLCMISWALYFSFIKPVTDSVGWFLPLYIAVVISFFGMWISMKASRADLNFEGIAASSLWFALLSALILRSSDFILNWSIKWDVVSIVGPLGGSSPALFAILSFFVFKERLKKLQIIGVVLTLIGIICLAFVSS